MAKELMFPLSFLANLTEIRKRKEGPLPSDLRVPGSIEQDADAMLFGKHRKGETHGK